MHWFVGLRHSLFTMSFNLALDGEPMYDSPILELSQHSVTNLTLCGLDGIWRDKTGSTSVHAMAVWLTGPSNYLIPCWLIISKVRWHLFEGNFTRDAINYYQGFWWLVTVGYWIFKASLPAILIFCFYIHRPYSPYVTDRFYPIWIVVLPHWSRGLMIPIVAIFVYVK